MNDTTGPIPPTSARVTAADLIPPVMVLIGTVAHQVSLTMSDPPQALLAIAGGGQVVGGVLVMLLLMLLLIARRSTQGQRLRALLVLVALAAVLVERAKNMDDMDGWIGIPTHLWVLRGAAVAYGLHLVARVRGIVPPFDVIDELVAVAGFGKVVDAGE